VIGVAIVIGLAIGVPMKLIMDHEQAARVRMAEDFAAKMQPVFASDTRLQLVEIRPFSGYGCVRLEGKVRNQADFDALQRMVNESLGQQPIDRKWAVRIDPDMPTTAQGSATSKGY
jgi:hypothetical protein